MARTKKVKAAGRLRAGYGKYARGRITAIESRQRKKQTCPYCKKQALKRLSKGVWLCKKCGKKFASHAYYLGSK
jgi:large subunit ribosomal protein L37Ae